MIPLTIPQLTITRRRSPRIVLLRIPFTLTITPHTLTKRWTVQKPRRIDVTQVLAILPKQLGSKAAYRKVRVIHSGRVAPLLTMVVSVVVGCFEAAVHLGSGGHLEEHPEVEVLGFTRSSVRIFMSGSGDLVD
jgi:hypothetical protein